MRIVVFSTDDFLYPAGGAETAFGEVARRLPNITFDLICAKLRSGVKTYECVDNVHIHRIGLGFPKLDGFLLALWGHRVAFRLAKKHTYDAVWSVMASYGAFAAVKVKNKLGIPFVLTLQEGDSFDYIQRKTRFVRKSFKDIFMSADALHSISRYLDRWGESMGFSGRVREIIPNGVDIQNFSRSFSSELLSQTRTSFGFPEDSKILITSSRLVAKNGVGDLVNALEYLPQEIVLVICGTGVLENNIRKQAEKFPGRVKFLGFVRHTDLPVILAASDIFVRPSITEGLGNAFLEAMAARRMVIGTEVGGIVDFLVDGETGFVCRPNNPQSIAETVQRVTALSLEEYRAITARAYDMVIKRYDWDDIARRMKKMFEDVCL